jgi:type I restriction enzyme S subunit
MTKSNTQTVPDGWRETTLGDVALIKGGKRLPLGTSLQVTKNSHPYIKATNLTGNRISGVNEYVPDDVYENIKRYIVDADDIVLSTVGTVGLVAQIPKDLHKANLTENCVKIKMQEDNVYPDFLYNYLVSKLGQSEIKTNTVGAVQAKLPIYGVQNVKISLPSITEQKAIADVLSSFDDKIELLREQNKTLEAMAQALFKHWFVDFEFPNKDGKPYKSSGGKMVDSELGEIPEGWRVGNVGGEFNITMGQSPRGDTYNENGVGTLFFQGRAEFGVRFPKARLYTTEPQRMAEQFDVLLSVRAPVGDINVASEDCCIGRGLASVNSKYKSYALYKIKSLKKWFNMFENEGTVFGSMNGNTFREIEVVIPDEKVIIDFEALANQTDAKFFNNHEQIQTLAKMRDTLLPKLMCGDVRVKI